MFERIDYIVDRIDGDYAYLRKLDNNDGERQWLGEMSRHDDVLSFYQGCFYKINEVGKANRPLPPKDKSVNYGGLIDKYGIC